MSARRAGFTIVELIAVVSVIGILVLIAATRPTTPREKAILSTMKSDLRNLDIAQEVYYADAQEYLSGTAINRGATQTRLGTFTPSPGIQIDVTSTGGTGWSAIASSAVSSRTCAMFVHTAAVPPATAEGQPDCQ